MIKQWESKFKIDKVMRVVWLMCMCCLKRNFFKKINFLSFFCDHVATAIFVQKVCKVEKFIVFNESSSQS